MNTLELLKYETQCWNGYPCTIICDRYTGIYSGGIWHAWPLEADQIPDEVNGDDLDSMCFWNDDIKAFLGFGATPQEAYANLYEKIIDK